MIQGVLTPRIHYTMSNFLVKGGKVTTPTITGDSFLPHDMMIALIKLKHNYLSSHTHPIAHHLPTLHNAPLNSAHY